MKVLLAAFYFTSMNRIELSTQRLLRAERRYLLRGMDHRRADFSVCAAILNIAK
jgi:hypothetical protein